MHKYKFVEPEYVLDLHGLNTMECKYILDDLCARTDIGHVRVIVGKGTNSTYGPVLPYFVKSYCNEHGIQYKENLVGSIDLFFNKVY